MNNDDFFTRLFSEFKSGEIEIHDLEDFIRITINDEYPDDIILDIIYSDSGVEVVLEEEGSIDIDIDWTEIGLIGGLPDGV